MLCGGDLPRTELIRLQPVADRAMDMWSIFNADPSVVDGRSCSTHHRFYAAAVTASERSFREETTRQGAYRDNDESGTAFVPVSDFPHMICDSA